MVLGSGYTGTDFALEMLTDTKIFRLSIIGNQKIENSDYRLSDFGQKSIISIIDFQKSLKNRFKIDFLSFFSLKNRIF